MTQLIDDDYKKWILEIKSKIRSAQMKAALSVNSALIEFYWDLGEMIYEKQESSAWGNKLIEKVASDLKSEFPTMKGLSRSNLFYAKQFYVFYRNIIVQQVVGLIGQQLIDQLKQIPWGHNILIFTK
jgi:predicted nuclease of restriction endonuclease-like (RecB) superfamily